MLKVKNLHYEKNYFSLVGKISGVKYSKLCIRTTLHIFECRKVNILCILYFSVD